MYAGDGKFFNGACDPNAQVVSDIHYYQAVVDGVSVTLPSMLFKPRRYVSIQICILCVRSS